MSIVLETYCIILIKYLMKSTLLFIFTLAMISVLPTESFSQNYIKINGEKIQTKSFYVNKTGSYLTTMAYGKEDNLSSSPFFGQKNAQKIKGESENEIGYAILGFLCPEARKGSYIIDYKANREFIPLLNTSKSEDSWDALIFDYFTYHHDDVDTKFMELWNSDEYASNQAKRMLLSKKENREIRNLLFGKFIEEVSVADYKQQVKKEKDINLKLEAIVEADLNEYLKTISLTKEKANAVKSETKINIQKKLNAGNLIEIKYYNLRLNGTFLDIVKKYARLICDKRLKNESLVGFEKEFYNEYMNRDNVFLISNMQYISYKIDKTKITNIISSITQDINASLEKNLLPGLTPSFSTNLSVKVKKEMNEDFKSEGGYVLQIAESDQLGRIDANCGW